MKLSFGVVLLVSAIAIVEARFDWSSGREWCADKTFLKESDISSFKTRNDNCSVDCTTQQATLLTFHVQNGIKCRGDDDKSRCFMGLCLRENEISAVDTKDLYEAEIYIKSANVQDKDPAPGMGGSDAIVMLEVARDGYPNYGDNQTICHTYIIQDNNNPRWNGGRGFLCRPMPLRKQATLRFTTLDSDKPYINPDLLGIASQTLGELMNQGTRRLKFDNLDDKYWLEVEVKASPYRAKN